MSHPEDALPFTKQECINYLVFKIKGFYDQRAPRKFQKYWQDRLIRLATDELSNSVDDLRLLFADIKIDMLILKNRKKSKEKK